MPTPRNKRKAEKLEKPKDEETLTLLIRDSKKEVKSGCTIYKYIGSNGSREFQLYTYIEEVDKVIKKEGPVVTISKFTEERIQFNHRQFRFVDNYREIKLDECIIKKAGVKIEPAIQFPLPSDSVVTYGRVDYVSRDIVTKNATYVNIILIKGDLTSETIQIKKEDFVKAKIAIKEPISFRCLWRRPDSTFNTTCSAISWILPTTLLETQIIADLNPYNCDVMKVCEVRKKMEILKQNDKFVFSIRSARIISVSTDLFYFKHKDTFEKVRFIRDQKKFEDTNGNDVKDNDVQVKLRYRFWLSDDNTNLYPDKDTIELTLFDSEVEEFLNIKAEEAFAKGHNEVELYQGALVNFRGFAFVMTDDTLVRKAISIELSSDEHPDE